MICFCGPRGLHHSSLLRLFVVPRLEKLFALTTLIDFPLDCLEYKSAQFLSGNSRFLRIRQKVPILFTFFVWVPVVPAKLKILENTLARSHDVTLNILFLSSCCSCEKKICPRSQSLSHWSKSTYTFLQMYGLAWPNRFLPFNYDEQLTITWKQAEVMRSLVIGSFTEISVIVLDF